MTEGIDMRFLMVVIGIGSGFTFCLVLCLAFLWGRRWAIRKDYSENHRLPTARPTRQADNTGGDFMATLESAQRRLESLLSRAETAEQKLSSLVTHSDGAKPDVYSTAAFLLANGEDVERVAKRVNLSSAQVRLIQELRQQLADKTNNSAEAQEVRAVRLSRQTTGKKGVGYAELIALGQNGAHYNGK